jgi:uncharacterized protein YndB with AHSA1/START domain
MRLALMLAALLAASPTGAEVASSSPNAFEIRHQESIAVPPARLWAALADIGRWWHPDHTYSGDSANLKLELRPGGCFCETTPRNSGGIEHMRVTYVAPGERAVLTGGLGPLLFEATAGVMDIQVKPAGAGSSLILSYRAAGFARGNAAALAKPVDNVLGDQVRRLVAAAAGRKP